MSDAQVPAVERRSRVAPTLKGVERAKILDELAALHEGHSGDVAAFRRAAVEILRAALDAGRDEARRALEAGGSGRACAETLSAETDELLRVGLEMSVRWLAPTLSSGPLPTIVAVGGYGR
ncbi:MAG TPA: bifunctional uridylyltransferase/uridylyl-removing protein, partial [Roseiarcus sp.]|nr:bifunctional uridylyltransferase/uridylyl-removing protein [Roseiarcus sp.]